MLLRAPARTQCAFSSLVSILALPSPRPHCMHSDCHVQFKCNPYVESREHCHHLDEASWCIAGALVSGRADNGLVVIERQPCLVVAVQLIVPIAAHKRELEFDGACCDISRCSHLPVGNWTAGTVCRA